VRRIDPTIHVVARACPLLVPLIEEGRSGDDPIVQMVLKEYLAPFSELRVSGLILGCTHYPILADAIAAAVGPEVQLIDSAQQTALAVRDRLAKMNALAPAGAPRGTLTCYVTDQGQRFERLATRFLGQAVGQPIWVAPEMLESQAIAL
jgi:glutamate racemase